MKFIHKGPIDNIPTLVQIMAWCRPGSKPLSEPMMISLLLHIYASTVLNELTLGKLLTIQAVQEDKETVYALSIPGVTFKELMTVITETKPESQTVLILHKTVMISDRWIILHASQSIVQHITGLILGLRQLVWSSCWTNSQVAIEIPWHSCAVTEMLPRIIYTLHTYFVLHCG